MLMGLTTLLGNMFGGSSSQATVGPVSQKGARGTQRFQYCAVLDRENANPDSSAFQKAWKFLEQDMAVVPAGPVRLSENRVQDGSQMEDVEVVASQRVEVDSFYIDKAAVTNADFHNFVKAGGYENMEYWAQDVWSHVLQFVDQTGVQAPMYWQNGKPSRELLDHPVVGVSWYEADAYARWVGKQLPDSAQWQRAVSWHLAKNDDSLPPKFPWGDTFESKYANAWISGIGKTVPVDKYYDGATPNGVYQLIGNTWEMQNNRFVFQNQEPEKSIGDLIEIRGGAFDTYLDSQMTSHFRTGHPLQMRAPNVGFRCVKSVSEFRRPE